MEPQILCKPAFRVVGISLEVEKNKDGLESLWENLAARYKEIPHADPDQGFGVHTFPAGEHHYLAGLAVKQDGSLPHGMAEVVIPTNIYAVFVHRGRLSNLDETTKRIFETWLPESGYQLAEDTYFEYYDDHFQPGSPDSVIFIFIPVRESSKM